MTTKARVFLNEAEDHFFGYLPHHAASLREVGTHEHDDSAGDLGVLEALFEVLNSNAGYDHRSLSVGDVIVLERDGVAQAWMCNSLGWSEIDMPTKE